MKYTLYAAIAASALMFTACSFEKSTPENAAQKHMKNQIAMSKGLSADTAGLTFTVIEASDDTALVEIGGTVAIKGQVTAVKNAKGQWEVQ